MPTISRREGSSLPIDFEHLEVIGYDGEGNPITADFDLEDRRVVLIISDKDDFIRAQWDSLVETTRMILKPDDGEGALAHVARFWPRYEVFRATLSPYRIFSWVYNAASVKRAFPEAHALDLIVNISPAYGTHDL